MKIAPLLAKFLYTNHRLELPGLGVFVMDPLQEQVPEQKGSKPAELSGISFESGCTKDSAELIQFIASETGKMKALAAADLASHIELARQFLNIGKPFLFEGIGSLVKQRSQEYLFVAGQPIIEIFPGAAGNGNQTEGSSESFESFSLPRRTRRKFSWQGPLVFLFILLGIALAIWAGYSIYKKTGTAPAEEDRVNVQPVEQSAPDPIQPALVTNEQPVVADQTLKFVLETASEERAFARYNKLKSFQWDVQLETADSVSYKLFLNMPAASMDTVRILDSLTRMNGKRVYIE